MSQEPSIEVYEDAGALSRATAALVAREAGAAHERGKRFNLAVSGGSTPWGLFRLLADEYADRVWWPGVHVYFVDERCVPPEHDESNFGAAHRLWLRHVRTGGVYRIKGEEEPETEALRYDGILREVHKSSGGLDLVMLGLGEDGHTASLFPGSPLLEETERLAVAVPPSGSPKVARVSMSLAAIRGSRMVVFEVSGEGKSGVVAEVLKGNPRGLPSGLVGGASGPVIWMLDRAAGSKIG